MTDEQKKLIRELIENNINQLVEAYQSAYNIANYQPHQVAVKKVYYVLNRLIPDSFRENVSMKNCMLLNSEISAMANSAVRETIDSKPKV